MSVTLSATRASNLISRTWGLSQKAAAFRPRAAPTPLQVRSNANGNTRDDDQPQASSSAPDFRGFGQASSAGKPKSKADALRQSLGTVSNAQGRVAKSTNVVFGTDESEEKWRELDLKVNEYPGQRTFKAIGSGGDDFITSMTACVQNVVGTVHQECVSTRPSSGGKWLSVTIGPVWVETPDQVLEIYNAMKADGRLKFYI